MTTPRPCPICGGKLFPAFSDKTGRYHLTHYNGKCVDILLPWFVKDEDDAVRLWNDWLTECEEREEDGRT